MTTKKLFKVKVRMNDSLSNTYSYAYVIAPDPTTAYKIYYDFLVNEDIGFNSSDREMVSIELIAEETRYPDCKIRLFLNDE